MSHPRGVPGRWLLAALAAGAIGCRSKEPEGFRRFAPPPELARKAVAAALDDWKKGRDPGRVAGTTPPVQVVDGHREAGRALTGFAILGDAADEGSRVVTARLTLANPEEKAVARYRVLGLDPVWVIRQEDLDMITHWEHPTPPADVAEGADAPESDAAKDEHGRHNHE